MQSKPHHVQRAYELLRLERYELALQEIQRALADDPDDADAHVCGAWVLRAQRRWPEAEQAARAGLHADPSSTDAQHVLAVALWGQGRVREAEQAFKATLQQPGGDWASYVLNYARLLLALGRSQEASALTKQALARAPSVASAHEVYGRALHARGQFDEAAAAYREALRLDPRNIIAQNNLGVLDLAAGRVDVAIERFQAVLHQQPSEEDAQTNLLKALKARNWLYRWVTRLRLGLHSRHSQAANRWSSIAVIGLALLALVSPMVVPQASIVAGFLLVAILGLFIAVAAISIIWQFFVEPVYNTLLFIRPETRYALGAYDFIDTLITVELALAVASALIFVASLVLFGSAYDATQLAGGGIVANVVAVMLARLVRGTQGLWRKVVWCCYALTIITCYLFVLGVVFDLVFSAIAIFVGALVIIIYGSGAILVSARRDKRK